MKNNLLVIILAVTPAFCAASAATNQKKEALKRTAINRIHRTGAVVYAVLHVDVGNSRQFWNNSSSQWETYVAAKWAQYAVPLTEGPQKNYSAAMPEGASRTRSIVSTYEQKGKKPAPNDKFAGNAEPDL